MKKLVIAGSLIFCLIFISLLVFAATEDENTKVNKAYVCLEGKINQTGCSGLTTEQRFFSYLTIGKCLNETLNDASSNLTCWPKTGCRIKDTAQAVIVLSEADKNTDNAVNWLLSHTAIAKEITWLLEIESDEETTCTVTTPTSTSDILIGEDKIIKTVSNTNCFSAFGAQSQQGYGANYWLKINPSCYNQEITIKCNKNFMTTLLYKKGDSITTPIYVSNEPHSGDANGLTTEKVTSYCFSTNPESCDNAYEGSLWAANILSWHGESVNDFMPYLILMAEETDNAQYVPYSFLYSITHNIEYQTKLLEGQSQQEGSWNGFNGKYYSTAVAMIPFSGSENAAKTKAKNWLLKSQDTTNQNIGCWNSGSIRDTGIILWSIWGNFDFHGSGNVMTNATESELGEDSSKQCESQGYCISQTACFDAEGNDLNLECSGLNICCSKPELLKTCSEAGGTVCSTGQTCSGSFLSGVIEEDCCKGSCTDVGEGEGFKCTSNGGTCRPSSCKSGEEEDSTLKCTYLSDLCCVTKSKTEERSYLWVWILIILIVLLILAIVFKNKIRELIIKIKSRKKSGGKPSGYIGLPPRGPPGRPMPARKPNEDVNDILRKLKEMGR